MPSPFDQTLGWMPGMAVPPWGDAPVPAGPYPVPAPVDLAPFDPGAPPSVQGGTFDLPPWESRPVPDLAGAVARGTAAAAGQIVDPSLIQIEPPQASIDFTPADEEAAVQAMRNADAKVIQIEAPPPDLDFTPEEAAAIARGEPYDADAIQIEQPAGTPASAQTSGRKAAPAPGQPPPWADPMFIKLAEVRDDLANMPPGPERDALAADLEAQTAWMEAQGIPVPGDEGIVIEPNVESGPPFDVGGGVTPGRLFGAPMGHRATDAEVLDFGSGKSRDVRDSAYAYANATPEQRAEMDAREAALYATKRQTMEMQQAEADRKAVEDNARIAKEARAKAAADMAQLQADVQGMADSSPFEAWWSDRSTGAKIAGVIGAIFSGLANPTGPNGAIDMMMKTADADAAQKWKKIEARRQLLGEQRAANQDDATEREKIRLASREQAIRMIEAQMNGLDPEGTQALALGHTIAGLRDADVRANREWMAADAARNQKAAIDAYNAESQRMQAEAQMLNAQSLDRQRGGRGAGGGSGSGGPGGTSGTGAGAWGDKAIQTGAVWAEHFRWPKDWPQPPAENMNGKEARAWFDQQKSNAQADVNITRDKGLVAAQIREAKKFNVDNRLTFNGKPLYVYGDDGKVSRDPVTGEPEILIVPSASREEMQKKLANAAQVLAWIGEAQAIRDGASTVDLANPKSAVSQKLDGLAVSAQLAMKDGTQGMSSDADGTNLAKAAGVANLRSVFSVDAALEAARRNLINKVNNDLRNQFTYTGPPLLTEDPPNKKPPRKENDTAAVLSSRQVGRGFTMDAASNEGELTLSESQKGKLAEAEASLDRHDADADATATGLASAALGAQNPAARRASAGLLWSRRKQGNAAAVAAYDAIPDDKKGAFLANLPEADAAAAFHDLMRARTP